MPRHQTKLQAAAKKLERSLGLASLETESPGVQVLSGAEAQRSATTRMRRVAGPGGVLRALENSPEDTGRVATLQSLDATDHTHGRGEGAASPTVPLELERQAILEVAAGASPVHVEVKYDLHSGYVRHALQRRFGSPEAAKEALRGFVLENALACQVVAAQEIPHMSGAQAVMSGAILIDKALALEKSIAETPKTVDFGALASMAHTLKVLREIAVENPSA